MKWIAVKTFARPAILATAPLLVAATIAIAGPPWISLEYPPNRLDKETRGALALVRIYHHENAGQFPVEGTAEGVVDGERVSLPLKFTPVGDEGVWATWGKIPEEGNWVLAIHGTDGNIEGARGVDPRRIGRRQPGDLVREGSAESGGQLAARRVGP